MIHPLIDINKPIRLTEVWKLRFPTEQVDMDNMEARKGPLGKTLSLWIDGRYFTKDGRYLSSDDYPSIENYEPIKQESQTGDPMTEVETLKNKLEIAVAALELIRDGNAGIYNSLLASIALKDIGMLDREKNYQSSSSEDAAGYRDMKAKQAKSTEIQLTQVERMAWEWWILSPEDTTITGAFLFAESFMDEVKKRREVK